MATDKRCLVRKRPNPELKFYQTVIILSDSTKKNIVLNLTRSLSANNFSEGERIHYKAFEKVINLIEQQKDKYKDYNPSDDEEDGTFMRCYNAFSVLGERGIEKTSFLMSLRNHLKCSKIQLEKETMRICSIPDIVIGSDEIGTFPTNIANEYACIYEMLKTDKVFNEDTIARIMNDLIECSTRRAFANIKN